MEITGSLEERSERSYFGCRCFLPPDEIDEGSVRSIAGTLAAPFPYFGGKALACETVWGALGENELLRIVLCGHEHEHDELLGHGWHLRKWTARKGYAITDEAVANSASETLWCSPNCAGHADTAQADLFAV